MRRSWTPSIVPHSSDETVYLVLNDFGSLGRAYCETVDGRSDLESVISDLMSGQYDNPVRVVAFNTAEGWSEDVSEDVARELCQRCADQMRELPGFLQQFVERYEPRYFGLQLALPMRY